MSGRRVKVVAAVVLICLLGGCASVTMTTTVDSEGGIEEAQIKVEMSQEVYAMALNDATQSGYESVGEQFADELEADLDGYSDVEYDEHREDGTVVVEIIVNEVAVEDAAVETRVTDNETVVFTEPVGDDSEDFNDFNEFVYRVEMPGEVVETNAEEIEDGNVAVWNLHETHPERMYVESEIEEQSWLWMIALVIGAIGVAMVGVAAYQMRAWESFT